MIPIAILAGSTGMCTCLQGNSMVPRESTGDTFWAPVQSKKMTRPMSWMTSWMRSSRSLASPLVLATRKGKNGQGGMPLNVPLMHEAPERHACALGCSLATYQPWMLNLWYVAPAGQRIDKVSEYVCVPSVNLQTLMSPDATLAAAKVRSSRGKGARRFCSAAGCGSTPACSRQRQCDRWAAHGPGQHLLPWWTACATEHPPWPDLHIEYTNRTSLHIPCA